MLAFFRKYQRYFFIITTVAVVITFSFFGTHSLFFEQRHQNDKVVARGCDGSKIWLSEVEAISHFISVEPEAYFALKAGSFINLLNDGVIKKDFIDSGIAKFLISANYEKLKKDFEERFEKISSYKPYVHPYMRFLSANEVWRRFAPDISNGLEKVKKEKYHDLFFKELFDLYLAQTHFSPLMLKQVIHYQESQYPNARHDEELIYRDLALFGFENGMDWFGKNFVDLLSQYIVNTALLAKQKGYSVSSGEALGDLKHNLEVNIAKFPGLKERLPKDANSRFFSQLQMMGLEEKEAVKIWQKVLLFRKYFQDVTSSIFVDPAPYKKFASFAHEKAKVDFYELPAPLCLKSFSDVLKLDFYLFATTGKKELDPQKLLPIDKIEKDYPELVEQELQLKIARVSLDEAVLNVSEKELWQWQVKDAAWRELKKTFPEFLNAEASSEGKRFELLEKLTPPIRSKVDAYSREQMVKSKAGWVEEAMKLAKVEEKKLKIRKKWPSSPLEGVKDGARLAEFLHASLDGKTYSEDGRNFYCFEIVKQLSEKRVLSFGEACEDGTLDSLVPVFLKKNYPAVRELDAAKFKNEREQWKPFDEVKELIGAYCFRDLLSAVDKDYKNSYPKFKEDFGANDSYAFRRLFHFVRNKRFALEKGTLIENNDQFSLVKREGVIARNSDDKDLKKEAFSLKPGAFSKVYVKDGRPFFYKISGFEVDSSAVERGVLSERDRLGKEAKEKMAKEVYEKLKGFLVVPLRKEV